MKLVKPQILLFLILSTSLLSSCSKTEDVTYDVYFWAASTGGAQDEVNLFVDDKDQGVLAKVRADVDCNVDAPLLEQLTSLQLSNGKHALEVKNESGDLKAAGDLEIKSDGISLVGSLGGFELNENNGCVLVKITH